MQLKFKTLAEAKVKAKEIVAAGTDCDLEDGALHIIHDTRADVFYVEDGCPMIRNFETVLWSL